LPVLPVAPRVQPAPASVPVPLRAPDQAAAPPRPAVAPPPVSDGDPDEYYRLALAAFDREEFAVAGELFDRVLAIDPEHPRALVGKGLLCANQGAFQEARLWCARAIRQDDLCADAYLLRGLILDMEGEPERALVEYQKVLWLERDYVMGHYFSAKCHRLLGNREQQARALRNALRSLEKVGDGAAVPFSGGLSRPVFLEQCRRELQALS
jgi:chemotaxis protein methyltransferase CheR